MADYLRELEAAREAAGAALEALTRAGVRAPNLEALYTIERVHAAIAEALSDLRTEIP